MLPRMRTTGKGKQPAKGKKSTGKEKQPAKESTGLFSDPDMGVPTEDTSNFPNQYCEKQFVAFFQQKSLHFERVIKWNKIPSDLHTMVNENIESREWHFIEWELKEYNQDWAIEFYSNFYTPTLKTVYMRGKQIPITEAAIAEILRISQKLKGKCAYVNAMEDKNLPGILNWDRILKKISIPGSA
ncbi:hypothetical protein HN51_014201 [Arachis hypogaea]